MLAQLDTLLRSQGAVKLLSDVAEHTSTLLGGSDFASLPLRLINLPAQPDFAAENDGLLYEPMSSNRRGRL